MAPLGDKYKGLFGTDGIRGTPGAYPLTDGMIFKIGSSAAKLLLHKKTKDKPQQIIIGKDTPITGQRIEVILADAMASYGIDVILAGTIPSGGIAQLIAKLDLDMGIMISASHNKQAENGIKFFAQDGYKLSPTDERWMEQIILGSFINRSTDSLYQRKGNITYSESALNTYKEFLESTVKGCNFEGFKLAIDCAYGASSRIVSSLFEDLGAETCVFGDTPDVEKITQRAVFSPSFLRERVLKQGADIGFAFDGDADRVVLIDEKGNILDGDYILTILGLNLLSKDKLRNKAVVTTIMSNSGIIQAFEEKGGYVHVVEVGDKHVAKSLIDEGLILGGEPTGHIIYFDYSHSPDGLLTALQILKVMKETKKPLSELAAQLKKIPQLTINVEIKDKKGFKSTPVLQEQIVKAYLRLKGKGRLSVRHSGTENVVRIMVEGRDKEMIEEIAFGLADTFRKELGMEKVENYAQN